jgi:hypothetical protein
VNQYANARSQWGAVVEAEDESGSPRH